MHLGRFAELSAWVGAVQARASAVPFVSPRLVVFRPTDVPHEPPPQQNPVRHVLESTQHVNLLEAAYPTSAAVGNPGAVSQDAAPADDEVIAAQDLGAEVADRCIDEGSDLLLLGHADPSPDVGIAATLGHLLSLAPHEALGQPSGLSDEAWMVRLMAVRDALHEARSCPREPRPILGRLGQVGLAALTGFLVTSATRGVPVVLDGPATTTAAILAERLHPGASAWWVSGQLGSSAAQRAALAELEMEPLLRLGVDSDDGTGALLALPILRLAGDLLDADQR